MAIRLRQRWKRKNWLTSRKTLSGFQLSTKSIIIATGNCMKLKAADFLEAHQSGERSSFVEDVKWRQENAAWLKRSQRVSYVIMDYMQANQLSRNDIAEKLGVSPQYVSRILSGKMNFTFKTISAIEERLQFELFRHICDFNG